MSASPPRKTAAEKAGGRPARRHGGEESAAVRKRGRPSRTEGAAQTVAPLLSREQILDRAAELAMVEPLAELSMVGLARDLGVTPALIHYYAGSREELISGVVNRYFKARVERLSPLTGDWKKDIERHARTTLELMVEYGGVLRYIMSHNRSRLFQQVGAGETDYGLVYLDRFAEIFLQGGFTAEQAAMGYHLLSQYVMSAAYAQVSHQLPAQHEHYIQERILSQPAQLFPAAHYLALPFSRIDAATAFDEGLRVVLQGIEGWLGPQRKDGKASKAPAR